jgi:ABC-type branched-subunit amino acid transport system substrate-binding protein
MDIIASTLLVPHISPGARSSALSDSDRYPYFIRATANFKDEAKALLSFIRFNGWKRYVFLHTDDEVGRSLSREVLFLCSALFVGL